MQLDDVLGRSVDRVTRVTTSTARSAGELVEASAVQATGSATRIVERSTRRPAMAAAVLALAALGGLVAMRHLFAGAIS